MIAKFRFRARLILSALVLFCLVLIVRLYFVQIIHGDDFSYKADRQYVRPSQSLFDRGSIFFTNRDGGEVPAATLKSGYIIAIDPSVLENPEEVYSSLSAIVPIDHDIFISRANKKTDPYEEITHQISEEDAKKIEALNIVGLKTYKERWRYYPGEGMAAQTLGFVAYDEDTLTGRYGLAQYYNDILERDDDNAYVNFFAEMFTSLRDTVSYSSEQGGNLITSIEPTTQAFLETEIAKIQEDWSSSQTGAVILDPKTGEIMAMGAVPSFNPNKFGEEKSLSIFSNPVIESVYEMGSIIKPLTLAAGLDAEVITARSTYNDKGFLVLNNSRIENYDGIGRGVVSMQEVLNQSLNTGAAYVALKLGNEKFSNYMLNYGLGKASGVDLPNDTPGLISNLYSTRDIEHATASYGQGIAMTPMVTTRALASLANGGYLVTPHVVKAIRSKVGITKKVEIKEPVRILKESTSEEITRMLIKVVDEALLDGTVKLEHYSIAAKTGTAQMANPAGGGYYKDRYLHSFFGYFPAYDPKFLVFIYTVNPRGVRYASQTLTTPFMNITKFLINYYEIPPDR